MSDFLENQRKKQQEFNERIKNNPQERDSSGRFVAEDEPEPLPEEILEDEINDLKNQIAAQKKTIKTLVDRRHDLEKENEVLREKITELEEGGKEQEGWMGPHEANALREENQLYKVKVINLQRQITRLQNLGHR